MKILLTLFLFSISILSHAKLSTTAQTILRGVFKNSRDKEPTERMYKLHITKAAKQTTKQYDSYYVANFEAKSVVQNYKDAKPEEVLMSYLDLDPKTGFLVAEVGMMKSHNFFKASSQVTFVPEDFVFRAMNNGKIKLSAYNGETSLEAEISFLKSGNAELKVTSLKNYPEIRGVKGATHQINSGQVMELIDFKPAWGDKVFIKGGELVNSSGDRVRNARAIKRYITNLFSGQN